MNPGLELRLGSSRSDQERAHFKFALRGGATFEMPTEVINYK